MFNLDTQLAAVDIGSNSFRLSIARIVMQDGVPQIYATDRIKETVRLASGLNEDNILNQEAIERAIHVLRLFGDRIEGFPTQNVRAVATNTFRVAKNLADFLPLAQEALGYPIEVISGLEEARLIYSGVAHELPPANHKRLVVDIGGGSTEFIIGQGQEPLIIKSLHMGCVSYTKRFFPDGKATEKAFNRAEMEACTALESIVKSYQKIGWDMVYGSSGTAKALVAVLESNGFSSHGITLEGMERLKKIILKRGYAGLDELVNLKASRCEVLPAGLAIMMGIFKTLQIKQMLPGEGALRVGVLYDMLGRQAETDKRYESVNQFMHRYHVSPNQAQRVKSLALDLFKQLYAQTQPILYKRLEWAADLHEVGLSISQSDYHRHSAYILQNADMPGFSKSDQDCLSLLVLAHQGNLSKILPFKPDIPTCLAILCLRLAVLFLRKRRAIEQQIHIQSDYLHTVTLKLDQHWLQQNPLIQYSLQLEAKAWKALGIMLHF